MSQLKSKKLWTVLALLALNVINEVMGLNIPSAELVGFSAIVTGFFIGQKMEGRKNSDKTDV